MRQVRQADVRFGVLDSDKSGAITKSEFDYSGWRMFGVHDSNKDGVVSAADPVKEETN
jgi:Ca2+-binding EF-hand superfamily protein